MYTAVELSKYIVSKCVSDEHPISNLQLQKILYYIQKDYIKRNELAFADEIEAWQFGPVVPNSYYYFCGFGAMPIIMNCYQEMEIEPCDKNIIDLIVNKKRFLNPWDMVEETHKPNGAWDKIYRNGLGNHQVIPNDLIRAEE